MDNWQQVEHTATGQNGEKYALINGKWQTVSHTATGAKGEKYALYATSQQETKEEPSQLRKLGAGLQQMAASGLNTLDTGVSLAASIPAKMFQGQEAQEEIFNNLNKRVKERDWGQGVDAGVAGKVVGAVGTLPLQMLSMGMSPVTTAKQALDVGESLPTAVKAGGIDLAGNVLGMAIPGGIGGSLVKRGLVGAGVNMGQELTTKTGIQGVMQTKQGKEMFAPTLEDTLVAGVVGGAIGAASKGKKGTAKTTDSFNSKLDAELPLDRPSVSTQRRVDIPLEGGDTPPVIRVGKDGEAYPATYENEVARAAAEQRQLKALDEQYADPFNRMARELAPDTEPKAPVTPVDPFEQIKQQALETGDQQRYVQAQAAIEARQKQLEFETARQATLDRNAAERTRQDEAPTGLLPQEEHALQQRLDETQPLPETATQDTLPFKTSVEEIAANQVRPEQPDLFAGADNKRIGKFGQGGSAPMFGDLAEGILKVGKGLKAKFTGNVPPGDDSIDSPISPENIAAKQQLAAKAKAIGHNSIYSPINTLEEVKALPAKDISPITTQQLGAGMEGALRRNVNNKLMQWVRNMQTKAETQTNKYLKTFITGKDGFNDTFKLLSTEDKVNAQRLAMRLEEVGQDYTPEIGQRLGLSPTMDAFMQARQKMMEGEYSLGRDVDSKLGLEHFDKVPGYARANFDSAYSTLVGKWEGTGSKKRFVPYTVLNANTKWEHKKALQWWESHKAEKGLTDYVALETKRKNLNTKTDNSGFARPFDPLAKIFTELAEINPDFAAAKSAVDEYIKGNTKKLGRYDYHSLQKMGVGGAIGRKPWLDAQTNADAFFKAEVNSFDQGFKYWNQQDMLNNIARAMSDPDIVAKYPETLKYLDKYRANMTGSGLNELGALTNAITNHVFSATGYGNASTPRAALANIRKGASFLMMGVWAPTFAGMQLLQYFASGIPEGLRVAKDFDVSSTKAIGTIIGEALVKRPWLELAYATGKLDKAPFDQVTKDALVWMKKHGVTDYNEVAQSHEASVNKKQTMVENALGWPMTVPEQMTRPTLILAYVDLMKGKLQGDELFLAAKRAADYAMTNYSREEAPLMYNRSGVLGENAGGLKKFVHNSVDQTIARAAELNKYPAAFTAHVGFMLALQGVTGMIGYELANQMSLAMTDEPLRNWLEKLTTSKTLLDGAASAMSGLDFQSRFSMAQITPNNVGEAVLGPHLMMLGNIAAAGLEFAKQPDFASFDELRQKAVPRGLAGYVERTEDGFVFDKEGQLKYNDVQRSPKEQFMAKHFAIKPIREKQEDQSLYYENKLTAKMNKQEKEQLARMKAALNLDDEEGFDQAKRIFLDNGGDPVAMWKLIKKWKVDAQKSARERSAGSPGPSLKALQKYQRYMEE